MSPTASPANLDVVSAAIGDGQEVIHYDRDLGNVLYELVRTESDPSGIYVIARAFDPVIFRKAFLQYGAFRTAVEQGRADIYKWAQTQYNYAPAECVHALRDLASLDRQTQKWLAATFPAAAPVDQQTLLRPALEKLQAAMAEVIKIMDTSA